MIIFRDPPATPRTYSKFRGSRPSTLGVTIMFGGPLREIENVHYTHICMLLILHPFPTHSFPRLPSPRYKLPDLRQGVLCTIGDFGLSRTWVYRGLGSIGGFFYRGKGNRGTWACQGVGVRCTCM